MSRWKQVKIVKPEDMEPGDTMMWRRSATEWIVRRLVRDGEAELDEVVGVSADPADSVRRLVDLEKFNAAEIIRLREQLAEVMQERSDIASSATERVQACERTRESDIAELQAAAQGERTRQHAAMHALWMEIFGQGSVSEPTEREQTLVRMLREERAAKRQEAQERRWAEDKVAKALKAATR